MANKIYPKFKQSIMQALVDMSAVNIKALLVTSGYTYSDTHQFLSDIISGNRVATSPNLGSKTFGTDGSFGSANVTFTAVSGSAVVAIVLYVDTGVEGTSKLIMYQDTGVTGLPLTPSGADIQIIVDAAGWFKL